MKAAFNYIPGNSPVHRLTGATKFVGLFLWSFAAMLTYDTRFLFFLVILGVVLFRVSHIRFKDISFFLYFTLVFLAVNTPLLYLFSPHHGTELYGTCTYVFAGRGRFSLTWEQLFYQLNFILKYLAMIPVIILFVSTTNPSEFAASLNKIGVPYSVAYSVALALRYIPDIQREYREISQAQQARGIEMSRKASLINRLKSAAAILIPLIMSSMQRIETVSNAMELRSFGKKKKRSWYMARPFAKRDFLAIGISALLLITAITLNILNGGRFWNPFI